MRLQGCSWCLRDGDRIWALHLTPNSKEQPLSQQNLWAPPAPKWFCRKGWGRRGGWWASGWRILKKKKKDLIIFVRSFCSSNDTQFFETVEWMSACSLLVTVAVLLRNSLPLVETKFSSRYSSSKRFPNKG